MGLTLPHLLLRNLRQYRCPELTFAGDEGSAILAVRQAAVARLPARFNPPTPLITVSRSPRGGRQRVGDGVVWPAWRTF